MFISENYGMYNDNSNRNNHSTYKNIKNVQAQLVKEAKQKKQCHDSHLGKMCKPQKPTLDLVRDRRRPHTTSWNVKPRRPPCTFHDSTVGGVLGDQVGITVALGDYTPNVQHALVRWALAVGALAPGRWTHEKSADTLTEADNNRKVSPCDVTFCLLPRSCFRSVQ